MREPMRCSNHGDWRPRGITNDIHSLHISNYTTNLVLSCIKQAVSWLWHTMCRLWVYWSIFFKEISIYRVITNGHSSVATIFTCTEEVLRSGTKLDPCWNPAALITHKMHSGLLKLRPWDYVIMDWHGFSASANRVFLKAFFFQQKWKFFEKRPKTGVIREISCTFLKILWMMMTMDATEHVLSSKPFNTCTNRWNKPEWSITLIWPFPHR